MRIIALDVHRSFAQTAILENGKLRDAGKVDLERNRLLQLARKLKLDDQIVIEGARQHELDRPVALALCRPGGRRQSDPGPGSDSLPIASQGGGVSGSDNAPCTGPIERFGHVVAHPILGGLHHRYARI